MTDVQATGEVLGDDVKAEWVKLAERLSTASPDKFREVLSGMREVVDAQELLARYDRTLLRGRPSRSPQLS